MSLFKKLFHKEEEKVVNAQPIDDPTIEFPYAISTHWFTHNWAVQQIISKYNLVVEVDFTYRTTQNNSSFGDERFYFKDKNIHTEICALAHKQEEINRSIRDYDKIVNHIYDNILFAAENKLTSNFCFIPNEGNISEIMGLIVNFYIRNDYKLPNANIFKSSMLIVDEQKKHFKVFVRNQEEAAQLMIELGNKISVIE